MASSDRVMGAVLAGGRSSRMGQDKADVLVNDHTMLQLVAAAVERAAGEAIVLGPEREGYQCWADSVHVQGPLAGIATALARTDSEHVLLVAVDHPFVRHETLEQLLGLANGLPVVPVDDHGVRQVTCAVYPKEIAGAAIEEAEASGSIQSLLDRVSFSAVSPDTWTAWGEDGRSWYSTDDPATLAQGRALYLS